MASFTYAANVKPLKERREEEMAEAQRQAEQYATESAQIYQNAMAAQEAMANQRALEARRAYNEQFDQNAAQQLANERRLQEQMANMGLRQSGYNVTNQTALALQRGRDDVATRNARQAAVDAIMQNLQQYQAEMQQQQAAGSLARKTQLQDVAANTAYDLYSKDVAAAQDMRDYVDSHNANIYQLMYNAYNSGNAALGNEYAKQLLELGDDGVVRPAQFNTAGAAAFANRVASYEMAPKVSYSGTQTPSDAARKVDVFGVPTEYDSYIKQAKDIVDSAKKEYGSRMTAANIKAALDTLVAIDLAEQKNAQPMTEDAFRAILRTVGIDEDMYLKYYNASAALANFPSELKKGVFK